MGVSLSQWRAAIGCASCLFSSNKCKWKRGKDVKDSGDQITDIARNRDVKWFISLVDVVKLSVNILLVLMLIVSTLSSMLPASYQGVKAVGSWLSEDPLVVTTVILDLVFLAWDVHTNPGPTCSQANCPGSGVLGRSPLYTAASAVDPLTRSLQGAHTNMGGVSRWVKSVEDTIQAFIAREYPGNLLGEDRVTVIPDLGDEPNSRQLYSAQGRMGGLVADELTPLLPGVLASPVAADPQRERILKELCNKFRGEQGEEKVFVPLYEHLGKEDVLGLVMSHKTGYKLIEKKMEEEVTKDYTNCGNPTDTDGFLVEVLCRVSQAVGVQVDLTAIEASICHYFTPGLLTVWNIQQEIHAQLARTDGAKHEREKRKKDMKRVKDMVEENSRRPTPESHLNPLSHLKVLKLQQHLNQHMKEHDTVVIHPEQKTVLQIEVKAAESQSSSGPVNGALKQLTGGLEELMRLHSHVLDQDWTFLGAVALPNVSVASKDDVCRKVGICTSCRDYILVGDMSLAIPHFLGLVFPTSRAFPDRPVWKMSHQRLMERVAALVHLAPALPAMQRITGETVALLGGASPKWDFVPDLFKCPVSDLVKWKTASHTGSPPAILFLNRQQLGLWKEKRVMFISDYGVGKTTMIKSKAISLASEGKKVFYIFLGIASDASQHGNMVPVMAVMNKQQMMYPNMTIVNQEDINRFYFAHCTCVETFSAKMWRPTVLHMLHFYLDHQRGTWDSVLVDECPVSHNEAVVALHQVVSWITRVYPGVLKSVVKFSIVVFALPTCLSVTVGWAWRTEAGYATAVVILLAIGAVHILCYFGGLRPSFSPDKTASFLFSYSDIVPSHLWVALHSKNFKDETLRNNQITEARLNRLKCKLASPRNSQVFTIPSLFVNMRNTSEVCRAAQNISTDFREGGRYDTAISTAVSAAPPPPSPRTNPCRQSTFLPLAHPALLEESLAFAYRDLIGVRPGSETTRTVVFLTDLLEDISRIRAGLIKSGISLSVITEYKAATDLPALELFLAQPSGILITSAQAFSGMEATTVVYVGLASEVNRSAILRAVEQSIWIKPITKHPVAADGFILDPKFLSCFPGYGSSFYTCLTCQATVCSSCALACHTEELGCTTQYSFVATHKKIFLFTGGCYCGTNGRTCTISSIPAGSTVRP